MSRSGRSDATPRVLLDATPLLGERTGIGRYTEHLLATLAQRSDFTFAATAFTLRGWRELAGKVPPGVAVRTRPFPARLLRLAWRHVDLPRVEWLAGRADIVHGTNFVLPPSGRAAGVVTVHDLAWHTHSHTMRAETHDLAVLVPRALRHAAAVCTLAEATKVRISEEFSYPAENIFVSSPGVDESWFDPAPLTRADRVTYGLPERYFVFVGTREPRKGLDTLLEAYRLFRAQAGDDAPGLLLVGPKGWGTDHTLARAGSESAGAPPTGDARDGSESAGAPPTGDARAESAGAPLAGVQLAGYLPQAILPSVVAGSLGLVLPSLDEGFGMPAIEALAAGVPVVTTDIPVLAEVTGEVGLRFPVGDAAALAGLLREVADGRVPPLADRIAWARRFTWERCAEQTVAAYRHALARR